MSFQAKLKIEDNEFNILSVEYAMTQPVDVNNRPNGRIRGGIIEMTLESGANFLLIQWATENHTKNGKIEFYRRDSTSVLKSVEFTNAFCIFFKELFISEGEHPMTTKITISAHQLDIQSARILNTWAGMHAESTDGDSPDTDNTVEF
jgi:hypothetical protein